MKLERILNNLGSLEKNSFIKIVDNIIESKPINFKAIEAILIGSDKGLKSADSLNISKIFALIENEFIDLVKKEFVDTSSQLDILLDIIIKDGGCILKRDWFLHLYESELKNLNHKIKALVIELENEKSEITIDRKRDYRIYKSCLECAYKNDSKNNRDFKITDDELSILLTLSNELDFSQEEIKLLNRMIVPIRKSEIDTIIDSLKNFGLIFYSKKLNTIYVADEIVSLLRKVRGKEIADKYFRRILRLLKEPQINLICKKHNIDRKLSISEKIKEILNVGVSFKNVLLYEIYKEGTTLTLPQSVDSD